MMVLKCGWEQYLFYLYGDALYNIPSYAQGLQSIFVMYYNNKWIFLRCNLCSTEITIFNIWKIIIMGKILCDKEIR